MKTTKKAKKTNRATDHPPPGGTVHHVSSILKTGGDVIFPSGDTNYPVTGTTDGGDPLLTNVEVTIIFWGDYWNQTSPSPSVSVAEYYSAFSGVVTGPYMTRLNQYRGVGSGTMLGQFIVPSAPNASNVTAPYAGYTNADVVNMLNTFFQNNSAVAPANGHNRFYAVFSPPGLNNSSSFGGQHQFLSYNNIGCVYAWVDSNDNLSDTLVFGHELVEACTNPLLVKKGQSTNLDKSYCLTN